MYDVAVLGDLNYDLVMADLTEEPAANREVLAGAHRLALGGSAGIFAAVLRALGSKVGFIGRIGSDMLGDLLRAALDARGIDTAGLRRGPEAQTGLTVSLVREGERALVTVPGAMALLRAADIPWDQVGRARHLHLASYYLLAALRPEVPAILAKARALGLTTSLDTGWDPADRWEWPEIEALLPLVDVFLPNETEALHLTGAGGAPEALDRLLAAGAGAVAVKMGARGALAGRGAERLASPPYPVRALDSTGAGDSFDAGFIHLFTRGRELRACLDLGNACGALAVGRLGGAEDAPDEAGVLSFMASFGRQSSPE